MKSKPDFAGATGRLAEYVPAGPDRELLLGLVRTGVQFQSQRQGRRPGVLAKVIRGCVVRNRGKLSFNGLLEELEAEALERRWNDDDIDTTPIEKVDRIFEIVTYHDPKRGRQQVTFSAIEAHLTKAKKCGGC